MNTVSVSVSLKKRLNTLFLICLSVISLITLCTIIWVVFVNSQDTFNLKRSTPYLLLPIYLIVRLIFLKIEVNKNIGTNMIEEIVKFSLFVYFLTIISMKVFPLDVGEFSANLLSANFLSFYVLSSTKSLISALITNFILFIPLGLLMPMVMDKFKNISNCIILGLTISVLIYTTQLALHFIGLYTVNIISLDLLLVNLIGATFGNRLYNLFPNYILSARFTNK